MPHGQFCWNELMTRNVERAKKFYGETIGWTFEAMPMPNGTYWVAKASDKPVDGIFDISGPEFGPVPESWMLPCESRSPLVEIGLPSLSEMPSDAAITQRPYFAIASRTSCLKLSTLNTRSGK